MLEKSRTYKVGKQLESWKGGTAQSLTFIVTEDCNLRCKYCYITHKSSNRRMSFETAKKFIDYILVEQIKKQEAVVLDFIGGEPFLETELIDKICDYFKLRTFELKDKWSWNYRINICTNGINYNNEEIQKFLEKNSGKLSMSITLDGTKQKHDLQRVFPDGTGSFDIVSKNAELWLNQFNGSTKVTFSSEDLKYLKESIIHLWNRGIKDVAANVVFENVWQEGDDLVFENQLKELADYILINKLYDEYRCTLFEDYIGESYTAEQLKNTSCGAGKMLALGADGSIFPCMRYSSYSLNNRKEYVIGDIEKGIDFEKVRPFQTVTYEMQSDVECLNCSIATGCSFCQGFNYDEANTSTNFQRAKYICKMHKARVRANNYYFSKLFNYYDISRSTNGNERNKLNFILSSDYVECCEGKKGIDKHIVMKEETMIEGLEFAYENFYKPVFIHSQNGLYSKFPKVITDFKILHIIPAKFYDQLSSWIKEYILVFDKNDVDLKPGKLNNCILNIESNDIGNLFCYIKKMYRNTERINLNIININDKIDLNEYEIQLNNIVSFIVDNYKRNSGLKELNVLTDILLLKEHHNCNAGVSNFTFAPNGNFYVCPSFYSQNEKNSIGNINEGINRQLNKHLYKREYSPLCRICDAYHCTRCVYSNQMKTLEVNVPSKVQCVRSHIERKIAIRLKEELKDYFYFPNEICSIDYVDPMDRFIEEMNVNTGFYNVKNNY